MTQLHHRFASTLAALAVCAMLLTGATAAEAFCGFYVSGDDGRLFANATQVVLMRDGKRTVLSMENSYKGPPSDFALVIPVPVVLQKEDVKTLKADAFDRIDRMASPRLVEYWEVDPCAAHNPWDRPMAVRSASGNGRVYESASAGLGVKIEAQFDVGEYQIVILSADDSGGLDKWLRLNKYNIPAGAEPVLRPYVQAGTKFFVAKVDAKKVTFKDGEAVLSPLRFHYDTDEFSLPIRLGLLNAETHQDLIVHILARNQRYEVANYKNTTIPTNIAVTEKVKGGFGPFYAALYDRTLEENPGAVVTEYSWDASNCDPCPGPVLGPEDMLTFGADTLVSGAPRGFVLTRLHARYTKETAGEDLVFKAAPPIVGGREHVTKGDKLEEGSQPGRINNFQGRYIIRHEWNKKIACESPIRGRWGGPWGSRTKKPSASAATNIGAVKRTGDIKLLEVVKQDIPEIKVFLGTAKAGQPTTGTDAPTPKTDGTGAPAPAMPTAATPAPAAPAAEKPSSGCAGSSSSPAPVWLALVVLVGLVRRRRGAAARRV